MSTNFANGIRCDIVIVNWNTGNLLAECLDSLRQSGTMQFANLIIVDNASSDDSLAQADLQDVTLVRNAGNQGFGAACNQGAALGRAPYLLLLNPDARLAPGALEQALDWLSAHEQAAYAVCGVALTNDAGEIARCCTRAPSVAMFVNESLGLSKLFPQRFKSHFMAEWEHHCNRDVDHVIGAFYLVRRDVFEAMCGFDERFFVYLEDLDLSTRIRAAGFHIHYLADVKVYHKGGGSSEKVKATRLFYALRSKLLYARKHLGRGGVTIVALAMFGVEPWMRCVFQLLRLSRAGVVETCSAYMRLVRWAVLDWPRGLDR